MRPLVQRENIKTQRKASLQRGQGERTHRSAGKEPSERLEGNQGRLAWQVGDRRVFQEGRSGKPCRELKRRQRARAPPHVATGSSGVNAAEAPSATPGRGSQVGRAEEGAAVRRERGGAATVRGLTDGSVAQCCGHPAHSGPQRRHPGCTTPSAQLPRGVGARCSCK